MKSSFKKLSPTLYECKYHIVMCPKYRHRIFKDEIVEYAKQQLYSLCRQKDFVGGLELNILADHIHLVVSMIAEVFGIGDHWVFKEEVVHKAVSEI